MAQINPYDNAGSIVLPALAGYVNFQLASRPVSRLPSAAANLGARTLVSDSTVPAVGNFGAVIVGGGSNTVPVYSNGVNWCIG